MEGRISIFGDDRIVVGIDAKMVWWMKLGENQQLHALNFFRDEKIGVKQLFILIFLRMACYKGQTFHTKEIIEVTGLDVMLLVVFLL